MKIVSVIMVVCAVGFSASVLADSTVKIHRVGDLAGVDKKCEQDLREVAQLAIPRVSDGSSTNLWVGFFDQYAEVFSGAIGRNPDSVRKISEYLGVIEEQMRRLNGRAAEILKPLRIRTPNAFLGITDAPELTSGRKAYYVISPLDERGPFILSADTAGVESPYLRQNIEQILSHLRAAPPLLSRGVILKVPKDGVSYEIFERKRALKAGIGTVVTDPRAVMVSRLYHELAHLSYSRIFSMYVLANEFLKLKRGEVDWLYDMLRTGYKGPVPIIRIEPFTFIFEAIAYYFETGALQSFTESVETIGSIMKPAAVSDILSLRNVREFLRSDEGKAFLDHFDTPSDEIFLIAETVMHTLFDALTRAREIDSDFDGFMRSQMLEFAPQP